MAARISRWCIALVVLFGTCVQVAPAGASVGSVFLQHRENTSPEAFPTFPERPFDVKSYDLTLDWRKAFETKSPQFSGKNIITLRLKEVVPQITLNAALMTIDEVTVNGVRVIPTPQPSASEALTISLDPIFQQDTTDLVVAISYHRSDVSQRGAYFYPKGTYVGVAANGDTVRVAEDIFYTMSEPLDADTWMPCMDLPYDKANSDITIIAPNGITTASNGSLIEKKAFNDSSTLWHWRSDRPIATYLMVANASTFTEWGETHQRSSTPGDTVHLVYYAWPEDYGQDSITDGSQYNAQHSLRNTSWIMSNFESRYGPFPFEKYGQVVIQRFDFGGMEHQSITSINRAWIRYGDNEGIAHEMAHQWFGDKVTCRTFKDIWLNEGFATYSQAIWYEGWGGDVNYLGSIRNDAKQYFYSGDSTISIYDPPGADDMFNLGSTVLFYPKAAAVIHMLRRFVNDDAAFFRALRAYTDTFAYANATTDDFQHAMSASLGIDLAGFIDQWIYGAGHPDYRIGWGQSAANKLTVQIDQTQTMRDHFTMPVHLFAYHGGKVDTLTAQNDSRSQEFQFYLSFVVDSLVFDDDALVLSTYSIARDPALEVRRDEASGGLSLRTRYDGNSNLLMCELSEAAASEGEVRIFNMLGVQMLDEQVAAGQSVVGVSANTLAQGTYIVRYSCGQKTAVSKVRVVR